MREWFLARLDRAYGPQHESFTVTAADGVAIRGVHLGRRGDPLVIFCHGVVASKNQWPVHHFVTRLAEDFDAVAFDFRGHGESGGLSTLGRDEVRDLRAVVERARGHGYRTIVAIGASMGGATALRYAGRYGDLDGIVTIGAFAEVAQLRRHLTRLSLQLLFDTPAVQRLSHPATGARFGPLPRMTQPLTAVQRVHAPLLVIHGAWDHVVEPDHARQLAARAAGPTELVIRRGPGHVNAFLDDDTLRLVGRWMNEQQLTAYCAAASDGQSTSPVISR